MSSSSIAIDQFLAVVSMLSSQKKKFSVVNTHQKSTTHMHTDILKITRVLKSLILQLIEIHIIFFFFFFYPDSRVVDSFE